MQRHFTASAFVIDSKGRVLLLWHHRLARWMPPGGHVESDEMPEETARRECKEETGLDVEILGGSTGLTTGSLDLFADAPHEGRMLKQPFAMLLEEIPATAPTGGKPAQKAHQHMDFLFLARVLDETQVLTLAEEEGRELRWFTREEILRLDPDTEIFRNVRNVILVLLR